MLLDLYYNLKWWHAKCAATAAQEITVPQYRLANGTYYTTVYWTWFGANASNVAYTFAAIYMLAKPYAGMRSQAANVPLNTTTGVPNLCTNIVIGTGTTPVTKADYMLESEVVTGLTCEAVSTSVDEDAKTVTYRKTVTNSGDADVTITEVGLTSPCPISSSSSYQALIYREVLDNAITIPAGESATVAVTIQFPFSV